MEKDRLHDDRDAEDIDVDEALTFPHPKHHKTENIDLMDTPHEEDMDDDLNAQDVQPSDYSHDYNEGTSVFPNDDSEEIIEEEIHEAGHIRVEDIEKENPVELMPDKFTPDEETTQ